MLEILALYIFSLNLDSLPVYTLEGWKRGRGIVEKICEQQMCNEDLKPEGSERSKYMEISKPRWLISYNRNNPNQRQTLGYEQELANPTRLREKSE